MRYGLDVRLTYYTRGGIATYARQLAAALPELDPADAHVHFYRRGQRETFSARAERVDCWTPAHHRLERLALSAEVLPRRLDVFHSPDFIPPLWPGGRSVITVHDLAFLHYPEFLTAESRRYYNGQIHAAVRQAHAISADSHATKADLVNLLKVPPDQVTVIPLGLDPAFRPSPAARVQATLARHRLSAGYLLFVGTFEPRKNVPTLLRAYAQLRRTTSAAPELVLVGLRGWLFEETLAQAQKLGLMERLHFLENVAFGDLPDLYTGAGAFVLPSHYEGFGLPVLEALGCGTPAVIANRASLPEVAGDAALAIDPDNVDELADALLRVLSDTALRARLIERGRLQAAQFTWEKTARATLALYQRTASR